MKKNNGRGFLTRSKRYYERKESDKNWYEKLKERARNYARRIKLNKEKNV